MAQHEREGWQVKSVSSKEFILAWNTSNSTREASEKIGRSKEYVSGRAGYFRSKGIPLKKYSRQLDWDSLKKIAEDSLQKGKAGK